MAPNYLSDHIHLNKDISNYDRRTVNSLHAHVPKYKAEYNHNSFTVYAPQIWNTRALPNSYVSKILQDVHL